MEVLHPQVVLAKLQGPNPEQKLPESFFAFDTREEAKQAFRDVSPILGTVHNFAQFLKDPQETLFDFEDLGFLGFSRSKTTHCSSSQAASLLRPWLEYARSEELWGPQGKWIRFHERLQSLFIKHQLLKSGSPGLYHLETKAKKLERFDVLGDAHEESFSLSLPWTFSLSDLKRIESIVSREFTCTL